MVGGREIRWSALFRGSSVRVEQMQMRATRASECGSSRERDGADRQGRTGQRVDATVRALSRQPGTGGGSSEDARSVCKSSVEERTEPGLRGRLARAAGDAARHRALVWGLAGAKSACSLTTSRSQQARILHCCVSACLRSCSLALALDPRRDRPCTPPRDPQGRCARCPSRCWLGSLARDVPLPGCVLSL